MNTMNDKYIIINKQDFENQKEELKKVINKYVGYAEQEIYDKIDYSLLSQSAPLIPEIEKAYEAGKLDKELSLSFDNPKGRYLSHAIHTLNK